MVGFSNIIGYYTSNACIVGEPVMYDPLVTKVFVEKDRCEEGEEKVGEKICIISPPFDFSQVQLLTVPTADPSVQAKLIESGHYQMEEDGVLHSMFLPSLRPYPELEREYHVNSGESPLLIYLAEAHPEVVKKDSTFVSPLIAGSVGDIRPGKHPVYHICTVSPYSNFAFPRICQPYTGLAESVRIEEPGFPPVYVVDNHHLAFFAWEEAKEMGYIQEGATLIHIDQHLDSKGEQSMWFEGKGMQSIADFTVEKNTVASFIMPALARETVSEFWCFIVEPYQRKMFTKDWPGYLIITSDEILSMKIMKPFSQFSQSRSGEKGNIEAVLNKTNNPRKIILDIDLDAFVPSAPYEENAYRPDLVPLEEDYQKTARLLGQIARQAGVVTIATSPYYADQDVAIPLARQIVRGILERK